MCIKIWCWSFYTLTLLLSFLWHLRFFFFWGSCIRNKMKNKKIRQREICWKMVAASSSSSSSSCIQFQLGVQIIFITFFTKHCWHSLFAMGGFLMTWACLQKRTKTLFGAVVVVVVMMGLGFPMMVVVQRTYMQVVRTGWLPEKNGNKRVVNSIMQVGMDSMLEKSGEEEEELRIILCWVVWTKESIDAWEEWEDENWSPSSSASIWLSIFDRLHYNNLMSCNKDA